MVGSTFAIEVLSSSSLYGVGTTVIKLLAWVYKAPKAFTRCRANGQELLAAKEREKSFRICNSSFYTKSATLFNTLHSFAALCAIPQFMCTHKASLLPFFITPFLALTASERMIKNWENINPNLVKLMRISDHFHSSR